MSIAQLRQSVADAANTVAGLTVRPDAPRSSARPGEGWVYVTRVTPAAFASVSVTVALVVVLSQEDAKSAEQFEEWGVPALDAVTRTIPCAGVALEPVTLNTPGGPTNGLSLTLSTEV